jgi:hypothetical protein
MNLRRPCNIIYFESTNIILFSILNEARFFYLFNIKSKKIYKKKKIINHSIILKSNENEVIEYEKNKNYYFLRNINNSKFKKKILNKKFKLKKIIKDDFIYIFGKLNSKNYLIKVYDDKFEYISINFCVTQFEICFFNNKILLANKKTSKIFEYCFTTKKLKYKFGTYGRLGNFSFRNISTLCSSNNFLYVNDKDNYKIKVFNKKYKFIKEYGGKGISSKNLDYVDSISVYKNKIFVADTNNDRILLLNNKDNIKILLAPKLNKSFLRRPIKVLNNEQNNHIVLDRDNKILQIFKKNFEFLKYIELLDSKNSKPNSFTSIISNKKILYLILFRQNNFKNYIQIYNDNFKFIKTKKVSAIDAQDITSDDNFIYIADTLGRKISVYNHDLKLVRKINFSKICKNPKSLIKSIACNKSFLIVPDFEKCKVYFFTKLGKIIKIFNFSKYIQDLKVIRYAMLFNNKLYILSRSRNPLWVYNLKNKKISRYLKSGLGNYRFYNPTFLYFFNKKLIIIDKENDQIKILNEKFRLIKAIPNYRY